MIRKIKHLSQRFASGRKEYVTDRVAFGSKVARLRFWDVLIPRGKSKAYIEGLSDFVCHDLQPVTERYVKGDWESPKPKQKLDKIPVWVCWWQGEEAMPPVVKACVDNMRRLLPSEAQLYIITWDNMREFVDLPPHILEKYEKSLITKVHLSDILRYALMSSYGGAWIDSTVWLTHQIENKLPDYLHQMYFTQRFAEWSCCPQEACRGKWCNFFFMGQRECVLFSYVYEALLHWWMHHDRLIDYVIVDYVIWAGYCGVQQIRQLIDAVPANNEHIWLMAKALNDPYEPVAFEELMNLNEFYKLSYKGNLQEQTEGQKTICGHILEEIR